MLKLRHFIFLFIILVIFSFDGKSALSSTEHTMPTNEIPLPVTHGLYSYDPPKAITGAWPYVPIHQHDDLGINSDLSVARKDFVPNLASISNITITQTGKKWSEIFADRSLTDQDIIRIPAGVRVIYDVNCCHLASKGRQMIKGLAIEGELIFDPTVSASLTVGTIVVYDKATLTVQPNLGVKHQVIFLGKVDTLKDPYQMSVGLVSMGGTVHMEGELRKGWAKIAPASQGQVSVEVEQDHGIRENDSIIFYSHLRQSINPPVLTQRVKVTKVVGAVISFDTPLLFEPMDYVVNTTRSVNVSSDINGDRAHMLFAGNTTVIIKNVAIADLGRTTTSVKLNARKDSNGNVVAGENQVGRYPLHAHHLMMPFEISGNVIFGNRLERVFQTPHAGRIFTINEQPLSIWMTSVTQWTGPLTQIAPATQQYKILQHGTMSEFYVQNVDEGWLAPESAAWYARDTRLSSKGVLEYRSSVNSAWVSTPWFRSMLRIDANEKVYGLNPFTNTWQDSGVESYTTPVASPNWAITSHNSFGQIEDNVIVGPEGSGIVGEEALESGTVKHNLVIGLAGGTAQGDRFRWDAFAVGRNPGRSDLGYGGSGFWFAGSFVEITDNIASGAFNQAAYVLFFPYDMCANVVPALNGCFRIMPAIDGMPEELKGLMTKAKQLRKFDNNLSTSYNRSGYSLMADGVAYEDGPLGNTYNDGYMEINKYVSYKAGVYLSTSMITLRDSHFYGNGAGIGLAAATEGLQVIDSSIENFDQGINPLPRNGLVLINTKLSNRTNIGEGLKKEFEAGVLKSNDIKHQIEVKSLVAKKYPGASYVAALTWPRSIVASFAQKPSGYAVIYVDKIHKTVRVSWDLTGLNNHISQINLTVEMPKEVLQKRGVGSNHLNFFKPVEQIKFFTLPALIKNEQLVLNQTHDLYVMKTTMDDFIQALESGVVRINVITPAINLSGTPDVIELEGRFVTPDTLGLVGNIARPDSIKEPVKPIEPVVVVAPVKPVEPLRPNEPILPKEPIKPSKALEPVKPVKPSIPMRPRWAGVLMPNTMSYQNLKTYYGLLAKAIQEYNNQFLRYIEDVRTYQDRLLKYLKEEQEYKLKYQQFLIDQAAYQSRYAQYLKDYQVYQAQVARYQQDLKNYQINYQRYLSEFNQYQLNMVIFGKNNELYQQYLTAYQQYLVKYQQYLTDYEAWKKSLAKL